METEMATVAESLACLRFSGQAPEYGKAPHSHTQGLTLKRSIRQPRVAPSSWYCLGSSCTSSILLWNNGCGCCIVWLSPQSFAATR